MSGLGIGRLLGVVLAAAMVVAGALGLVDRGGGSGDPGAPLVVGFSPGSFVLDISEDELADDLDAVVGSGARWMRFDIDWSRIERERGAYNWTTSDTVITAARARGLEVLGLITYTPSWARPDGTTDKHPPDDLAEFARFAADVVERYRPFGVTTWEIWNEPNTDNFWSTGPDPVRYAQLLTAASDAIRAVDPAARIIAGGLAPAVDAPGSELSPHTYLSRFYAEVSPAVFDAIAVHPYSFPALPSENQDWNTFARLEDVRQLMVDNGDEDKLIWLTEFGAPTGTGSRAVTPAAQATMVIDAIETAETLGWVGPLFLYSHRDIPGGAADDLEANFGLRLADGTPKPAWVELTKRLTASGSN